MQRFSPDRLFERVRVLRESMGLTQEQFAEQIGMSYKYFQALEAGRKSDLRLSTLKRLAKGFGIELWQLFGPELPVVKQPRKRQ